MKKVVCEACGSKRGRRECPKYSYGYICGDCCSSIQINSECPKSCIHIGKYNQKDLSNRIQGLIEAGISIRQKNPQEAIKYFDKVLELDKRNVRSLIEKSVIYDNLKQYDKAIECLKTAYMINNDGDLFYRIAVIYRKANRYQEAIDSLLEVNDTNYNWKWKYLLGECYFLLGRMKQAVENMERVVENPDVDKEYIDGAASLLSKAYMSMKNTEKSLHYASLMSDRYAEEKMGLIERAYFLSGRMYELIHYIGSLEKIGYGEKFLLLECALVLKKGHNSEIINIIDDILASSYLDKNEYELSRLLGVKIRLLFKDYKIEQAYEIFKDNRKAIISMLKDVPDCYEACSLMAFFLYSLNKAESMNLYRLLAGGKIDEAIVDEIFQTYETMHIPPYYRARCIDRSINLVKNSQWNNSNYEAIAADVLYEHGEYSEALQHYCIAQDNEKPDVIIMYKASVCLLKTGKYSDALDILVRVINMTRFIPGAFTGMIKCCLELNMEWSGYFRSLEVEKLSFNEIYELACQMIHKEHYDKAGYLLSYIVEKYKSMDIYSRCMVYHGMSIVYQGLKEYPKGIEMIMSIPENFLNEALLLDLGCLYSDMGELDKAVEMFQKTVKHYNSPTAYYNLGIISVRQGKYKDGLELFKSSMDLIINGIHNKSSVNKKEYHTQLSIVYKSIGLCKVMLGKTSEALLWIDKSNNIQKEDKKAEIISEIQRIMIRKEKNIESNFKINDYLDSCSTIKTGFTEGIRNVLENVLSKYYSQESGKTKLCDNLSVGISNFIGNERKLYSRNNGHIEHSQAVFQRHVDRMVEIFETKVIPLMNSEVAAAVDSGTRISDAGDNSMVLIELGSHLLNTYEYTGSQDHIYASLIPYFKAVKQLAQAVLCPYYKNSVNSIPVPAAPEEFKNIGIYCYSAAGKKFYRVDFSFNISCSEYLFEVNCHPGLRNKFIDYEKHYMPWDKLLWMLSGVKKKWDIIDDIKSAGLLLLFYYGYKNYLQIDGDFSDTSDIIKLAGDLIRLGNERDHCIKSMITDSYEPDCLERAREIQNISLQCIRGLSKIKRM